MPSESRPYAIAAAMDEGFTVDKIHALTFIDTWFLSKLRNIFDIRKELASRKSLVRFVSSAPPMRAFLSAKYLLPSSPEQH